MADRKKLTEKVQIDLSEAQLLEIGRKQADLELLYAKVELEKSAKASEYAERLKKLWAEIQELATSQKERKRIEEIEIKEIFDTDRNQVKLVRADDERQVIKVRGMSLTEIAEARQQAFADKQKTLPLDGKAKAFGEDDEGQKVVQIDRSKGKKKKTAEAAEETEGSAE